MKAAPCAVCRPPSSFSAVGYSQRSKRSFTVRAPASSSHQSTHALGGDERWWHSFAVRDLELAKCYRESAQSEAAKVTVSKDNTVILDGFGDKKAIEERCEQLRGAIEHSTSDYDKEKLQERLTILSGGVVVLKIKFCY
ncbi:Chaperonin CPN60 [Carex littledalei]|uniref:Chaperonin CPN60 n=1 Tax=Carex littledalei TaxID=544730 RepID=A0A833RD85_9POAL|nr:Chaperonin CPN60 [Carex littledalei]